MPIRPISKELQEVAIEELHEDPTRISEDLAYIREWLSKQPHIKARQDDQFLVTFLRGCKYSLERTKEKLDMYYTCRTIIPEFFENRDPFDPEIQKVLSAGPMFALPKLANPTSPRYILMRQGVADKNKLDHYAMAKVSSMMQDICMIEDDNYAIAGMAGVQDMSDVTLSYSLSMPPSLIKKAMTCFQQGYPQRIKGMHFFNISSIFETIHNMFKPFLTEKLKKRMQIHSSMDELYKHVPKEILPEEYGGQGGKIDDLVAYWKAKVESYRDWFVEDAKYRTDETKRPGKPKTSESVFGLEGSFRKLAVD